MLQGSTLQHAPLRRFDAGVMHSFGTQHGPLIVSVRNAVLDRRGASMMRDCSVKWLSPIHTYTSSHRHLKGQVCKRAAIDVTPPSMAHSLCSPRIPAACSFAVHLCTASSAAASTNTMPASCRSIKDVHNPTRAGERGNCPQQRGKWLPGTWSHTLLPGPTLAIQRPPPPMPVI